MPVRVLPWKQCRHYVLLNLRCAVNKLVLPEIVGGVFNELYERDEEPPGVWSIDDEPLQEDAGHLLLYGF